MWNLIYKLIGATFVLVLKIFLAILDLQMSQN